MRSKPRQSKQGRMVFKSFQCPINVPKNIGFEYFIQCKHHIALIRSWNKLIQNINKWNKIIFPTLKLLQGETEFHELTLHSFTALYASHVHFLLFPSSFHFLTPSFLSRGRRVSSLALSSQHPTLQICSPHPCVGTRLHPLTSQNTHTRLIRQKNRE